MSQGSLPDEFIEIILPLLPPDKPIGPLGGRPAIRNLVALRVIWYVLANGILWAEVLPEMGCSGRTAQRRLLAWQQAGCWTQLHATLLELLHKAGLLKLEVAVVDSTLVPAPTGGEATGPNPTDRAKTGSKHTLLVDGNGVPLALKTTGANVSDQRELMPVLTEFPKIQGKPGRPRKASDALYADRGYDNQSLRLLLRWLGIEPFIAKRNTAHGSGLGQVRWVVERTNGWIKGLKRLRVRGDRLAVIQDAWNLLAMSVICFRLLQKQLE